jgi:hypothetical protein
MRDDEATRDCRLSGKPAANYRYRAAPGPPIMRLMDADRDPANPAVLGRFAYFGTVPACIAGIACWAAILISDGSLDGLKYAWLLVIAAYLGLRPLLAKLRVDGSVLRMTIIGPWRQSVDLAALESVQWKRTGGPASRGSMFVRDARGGKVRIGVGDFTGVDAWGPLILSSAEKCSASVDDASRHALQGAGRRDRPNAATAIQDR